MAAKVLLTISKDEMERASLMSQEKYELDRQSELVYAKRRGIKKGKKEGIIEGRVEGRVESESFVLDLIKKGHTAEEIEKILRQRQDKE
jgi:flagellar biosynthesis/type III secretory pathway protein FliH